MRDPYHTALIGGAVVDAPPLQRVEFSDGVAFVHDLFQPIPAAYEACDAIYCEAPWRHGYDEFNRRAGWAGPSWVEFTRRLGEVAATSRAAVCLTAGRQAVPHLPTPDHIYDTSLNGAPALLVCYRLLLERPESAESALDEIATRYTCIGDWCCGYGRTVRAARRHGKRYVVSDHNATCIGYIAQDRGC